MTGRYIGEYEVLHTLGKGISGKVKLGRHRVTGDYVALKIMNKSGITQRQMSNLQREITAMKRVSHPFVLPMIDFILGAHYPKKNGTTKDIFCLVVELASGGELFDFMMYTGSFPEHIARAYFQMLIQGLKACHAAGVHHRDIKPENLLLAQDFSLKIADFGLAAIHEEEEGAMSLSFTACGTQCYMAPEVIQRKPYNAAAADIWSAGCVLFVMLAAFPPFNTADPSDWWFGQLLHGRYQRFWEAHRRNAKFSLGAMQLLSKIFVIDPKRRATIADIEADPWYQAGSTPMPLIVQDLQNRKAQVEEKKRLEKEQKAAGRQSGGGGAGDEFDPFSSNLVRSVSYDYGAETPKPIQYEPHQTEHVARYTHFFSALPAPSLLGIVEECLRSMGAQNLKVNPENYKIKALVQESGAQAEVVANIYESKEENLRIVSVSRRSGSLLQFQQIFKRLCEKLSGIVIDPPPKGGPAAAIPAVDVSFLSPTKADAEEDEELSENVTLI